jgi:2-keto-4-pentenoate hydratase/2-oxohepta-3-ene-1,7-dioic acid hydratase in catechol pathway
MRLAHLVTDDGPRLATAVDGGYARLDALLPDAPTTLDELLNQPNGWLAKIAAADLGGGHLEVGAELAAPFAEPRAVIAIGLNYHDHCREFGTPPPVQPIVFVKLPATVVGPTADVTWNTSITTQVDWEAELGVVIGREARNVDPTSADDFIFGYTAINDVTARDVQRSEQQWVRAKSLDTFCPIGPVVVTRDELDPAGGLAIRSWVNGTLMQESSTVEMIFGVRELVSYLSHSFTLRPGDVIATGTPLGVGAFRTPPIWLGDGDVVEVEIEGIGRLRNRCRVTSSEES